MLYLQIKTWTGLEAVLQKEVEKAVLHAGETIKQVLIDSVNRMWYSEHTPEKYKRTMGVLKSITLESLKQGKNGSSARIYFDETKILSRESDGWNQHMSLDGSDSWKGEKISVLIPLWMDQGQTSRVFPYKGSEFFTVTEEYAQDEAIFLIDEALKKAGFSSVVVG